MSLAYGTTTATPEGTKSVQSFEIGDSVLAGVFAGIVARFGAALRSYVAVGRGIAVFAAGVFLHHKLQLKRFAEVGDRLTMPFPKESNQDNQNPA